MATTKNVRGPAIPIIQGYIGNGNLIVVDVIMKEGGVVDGSESPVVFHRLNICVAFTNGDHHCPEDLCVRGGVGRME